MILVICFVPIVEDLMTIFIPNDPKHNSTHGDLVAEKAL